jgi:hypothetical protein
MSPVKNTKSDAQTRWNQAVKIIHGFPDAPYWVQAEKLSDVCQCNYYVALNWIRRAREGEPPAPRGGHRPGSGFTRAQRQARQKERETAQEMQWLQEKKKEAPDEKTEQ